MLEEKVLYNVLTQIKQGKPITAAPDDAYVKALETLGVVTLGWDNSLTPFGYSLYNYLENKLNKW